MEEDHSLEEQSEMASSSNIFNSEHCVLLNYTMLTTTHESKSTSFKTGCVSHQSRVSYPPWEKIHPRGGLSFQISSKGKEGGSISKSLNKTS